jgi:hypothetical protein
MKLKNKILNMRTIGIVILVTAIGFSMAGCGDFFGEPPAIATTALADGMVGTAYNRSLQATGKVPFTWSINSGTLPAGLSLGTTGIISGTPTTAGTSSFTVKVENSGGNDTMQLSITILAYRNSAFIGRWKPLNEDGEETAGFYIFSSDGTYEMSAYDGASLVKGTYTTTGTTSGSFTLTPTQINGTVLLSETFVTLDDSLFKTKLEARWYTAEEYAVLVADFINNEVPAALAAETAIRYAEIDADNTKTSEEKATAKEWVDFELGLKYLFVELFLPAITLAFVTPTPAVYEDPALNGTATYALTSNNRTLTFTVVTKEKNSETGVITSKTSTTTLKKK